MSFKKISVIGLGYIGLPTAAMFASRQIQVIGVDVNQTIVDIINQGKIHIVEPDLDIVVNAAVTEGYLKATTKPEAADAFIIAVPTPFKEGNKPDLSYIKAACYAIAPVLSTGALIILESTSPVGATEKMVNWLADARPDLSFPDHASEQADVNIAHCPERVLPGQVMRELIDNARIIGGMTPKCAERSVELYRSFVKGECITTDARTAEMAKLTENSFRDVNIAFANELSIICDKLDIDVWELIQLSNLHPRVNILQPGCGVGGHCIAVDPWFIVDSAPKESRLIHTARIVNDDKPRWVIDKVKAAVLDVMSSTDKAIEEVNVACFGLAFKPNIDDLRESPALKITKQLSEKEAFNCVVVEPNIDELPSSLSQTTLVSIDAAIEFADICLILVAHDQFLTLADKFKTNQNVISLINI